MYDLEKLYQALKTRHQLVKRLTYLEDAKLMGWIKDDAVLYLDIETTKEDIEQINKRIKVLRHG